MTGNNMNSECEPPFWKDIYIIFNNFSLEFQPSCPHSAWNFAIRLIIISLFVGMIASVLGGLSAIFVAILIGTLTAVAIIITTSFTTSARKVEKTIETTIEKEFESVSSPNRKKWDTYHTLPYIANVDPSGYLAPANSSEGFINGGSKQGSIQPFGIVETDASPYYGEMLPEYTPPTARNLFMNVLLDEIKYNPGRGEAYPVDNATVKQTFDDYFRVQWYSDPTDVFGKNQGQRQFITQPSTTVPNDQGAFANWLYKIPGKTCKEGGREACLAGTDGSPVTWLNMDS